jgi:hypothetical protein
MGEGEKFIQDKFLLFSLDCIKNNIVKNINVNDLENQKILDIDSSDHFYLRTSNGVLRKVTALDSVYLMYSNNNTLLALSLLNPLELVEFNKQVLLALGLLKEKHGK